MDLEEFLLQPVEPVQPVHQQEPGIQLDFIDLQPVNLIEYITRAENELQDIVNTGGLLFKIFM